MALLLFRSALFAQEASEEFGVISMKDLAMTTYSADSAAEAVVLFDKEKPCARTKYLQ